MALGAFRLFAAAFTAGSLLATAAAADSGTRGSDPVKVCDTLTAQPSDTNRPAEVAGTIFWTLYNSADRAIPACKRAIEQHPEVTRYRFQLARVLFAQDDDTASLARAAQIAQEIYPDYPPAGQLVAYAYRDGVGVKQDKAYARLILRAMASRGVPLGLYELGLYTIQGQGVAQPNLQIARQLMERAAAAGSLQAHYDLALMALTGLGHPKDGEAFIQHLRATRFFTEEIKVLLAEAHRQGFGVEKDVARAKTLEAEAVAWAKAQGWTDASAEKIRQYLIEDWRKELEAADAETDTETTNLQLSADFLFDADALAIHDLVERGKRGACSPDKLEDGPYACIAHYWTYFDVGGGGDLTRAEISRALRHFGKYAIQRNSEDLLSADEKLGAQTLGMLALPTLSSQLLGGYDYDGNGRLSQDEAMTGFEDWRASKVAGVPGMSAQLLIDRARRSLPEMLRNLPAMGQ